MTFDLFKYLMLSIYNLYSKGKIDNVVFSNSFIHYNNYDSIKNVYYKKFLKLNSKSADTNTSNYMNNFHNSYGFHPHMFKCREPKFDYFDNNGIFHEYYQDFSDAVTLNMLIPGSNWSINDSFDDFIKYMYFFIVNVNKSYTLNNSNLTDLKFEHHNYYYESYINLFDVKLYGKANWSRMSLSNDELINIANNELNHLNSSITVFYNNFAIDLFQCNKSKCFLTIPFTNILYYKIFNPISNSVEKFISSVGRSDSTVIIDSNTSINDINLYLDLLLDFFNEYTIIRKKAEIDKKLINMMNDF